MHEPSPRTSRLVVAGSAAAVVLLAGGGFLLGRGTAPTPPPVVVSASPAPVIAPVVAEKPAARTVSRADVIAYANAAADSASSGTKIPESAVVVEGARFVVDLPFGCDGPATADSRAPSQWRYDSQSSSLRVSVAPAAFDPTEWLGEPSSDAAGLKTPSPREEAIEGFWIERPWSSRETCAPGAAQATRLGSDAATMPGQTLALAQIFTDEDSRSGRRDGKPYESVRRLNQGDLRIEQGLRVRVRGRIAHFPDGSIIRCRQPASKDQRPVCLLAVTFDDVAIENPSTADVIATWGSANPT